MGVMLEMTGIEKRFPGVHALKNCHFDLKKGEIHALIGENGAGKFSPAYMAKTAAPFYTTVKKSMSPRRKKPKI